MLPLRGVVEAMGGSLTWDAKTRTITMTKDNQNVKLTVGSTKAIVDGTTKDMLANGSTYKALYISSAGEPLSTCGLWSCSPEPLVHGIRQSSR